MIYPNFDPFPELHTERTFLRKLSIDDAPEVFIQRSHPVINKYIKREPTLNIEDARVWINKVLAFERNNESVNWAICLKGESKLIGSICLWNIEKELDRAELGYSLHCDYFGMGLMSEVAVSVLKYGFEQMKLERIDAFTNKENSASLKLLQKNGFTRNFAFEKDYPDKEELEYNGIYTLLNATNF